MPPPSLPAEESGEHFFGGKFDFFNAYIYKQFNSVHVNVISGVSALALLVGGLWGSFTLTIVSLAMFSFFTLPGGSVCARISELNLYPSAAEPKQFNVR